MLMVTGENEVVKLTTHNQDSIYLEFIHLFQLSFTLLNTTAWLTTIVSRSKAKLHEIM